MCHESHQWLERKKREERRKERRKGKRKGKGKRKREGKRERKGKGVYRRARRKTKQWKYFIAM